MNRHYKTTKLKNPENGFTIVETLVAIAILMIAIAGPLVVANKSLTAALYAKDYAIGSFLAQEGIELIRNSKDNGIGAFTFSSLKDAWGTCHTSCRIDVSTNGFLACPPNNCTLYTVPTRNGYAYSTGESDQEKTIFSREFHVSKVTDQTTGQISTKEVKVTVRVWWNEGTVENEVVINSQMVENSL